MISALENHKDYSLTYRLMISDKPQYTRMTVRKSSDGTHFIIGVENIDDEIKRKSSTLRSLKLRKNWLDVMN